MQKKKLLNSIQRALQSFSLKYEDLLPEPVLDRSYERSKIHSEKIVSIIPNESEDVLNFCQGLALVGMYSGFLCGFLSATLKGFHPNLTVQTEGFDDEDTIFDNINELFKHAYISEPKAKLFAVNSASVIFTNLKKIKSPLIENMPDKEIEIYERVLRGSLYSGFMDGFESAVIFGSANIQTDVEFENLPFLKE